MRAKNIITILGLLVVAGALFLFFAYSNMHPQAYEVALMNNAGEQVGTATLEEGKDGVQISVQAQGIAQVAGTHAIHIHETADCTPLDSFTNAGGHFNPATKDHGVHSANGQHAGDMPNIAVDSEGNTDSVMVNHHITLQKKDTGDGRYSVFDADGSALMIHAGADDYKSQPSGAAGARIVCGVIK